MTTFALTQVFVVQPPFVANPRHDPPEQGQSVPDYLRTIKDMDIRVDCLRDAILRVSGHAGFQIENCMNDQQRNWVEIRIALNGTEIDGTRAGMNIWPWLHYLDMPFAVVAPVWQGSHRVELQARAERLGGSRGDVFIKPKWANRMQLEVFEELTP